MTAAILIGCAVVSYLLGSIPTGYLWAKARGIDIRTVGSGNIGATNVMRALGKGPGITVLAIDALKGFLPVLLAPRPEVVSQLGVNQEMTRHLTMMVQITCCVSVIAGHNWTCWLKFKGGKGVATSAGAMLAMLPVPLLCALAVWGIIFAASRYVSLASIAAAAALPVATWFFRRDLVWFTSIVGVVIIYKHKSNIQRLRAGTENRIGTKKA